MKPITLNKDSWHFRLVTRVGLFDLRHYQERDYNTNEIKQYPISICDYFPAVLVAMLWAAFLIFTGGFVGSVVLAGLIGIVFLLIGHAINGFVGAGIIIDSTAAIVGLSYGIYRAIKYYRSTHVPVSKEPGFVKLAYRAWHDKICIPIKFED